MLNSILKYDFSVWQRTSSNPADINRFQSRKENSFRPFRLVVLIDKGLVVLWVLSGLIPLIKRN